MKKCPYCAEEIQDDAIVCKHCGRELTAYAPTFSQEARRTYNEQGVKLANNALTQAIISLFCFGIILGPIAISNAKRAKNYLNPGDPGYGSAQAAEIIGWIVVALYIVGFCVGFASYLNQSSGYY